MQTTNNSIRRFRLIVLNKFRVKENPWQAVGIAASLGLLLGALMKKEDNTGDTAAADPKVIEASPSSTQN
jgi:hypothetical protein